MATVTKSEPHVKSRSNKIQTKAKSANVKLFSGNEPAPRKGSAPSEEDFQRYLALEEKRLELGRKAAAIKEEANEIYERISEYADRRFKATTSTVIRRLGFAITKKLGSASISWKKEFVRVAGSKAAARVSAIAAKNRSVRYEIDETE